MSGLVIRHMLQDDMQQVIRVQADCYQNVEPEDLVVLENKRSQSPGTCWVAEVDGSVVAYLICHPWDKHGVPALNAALDIASKPQDVFYLHDLAVSVRGRGRGIADTLVNKALQKARSDAFQYARLVAVQGARSFWQRYGFATEPQSAQVLQEKRDQYGDDAFVMGRVVETLPEVY
ncbi:GNAT family N-acetyltransferase [Pokkaliibacter plantistimulans]|nr:GNAT family N-acetyltransferase [Pokkaliibacter plantistimulans]PPC77183.1 N-acetyltransferase [Pokkaliibacter plantistimulans]